VREKHPVIGIDASRMVGRTRTGTENYSDAIIRALLAEPVDWTWRLYFNGNAHETGLSPEDTIQLRDIPARRLWTHLRLSREMATRRPDGLFVPAHVIPAAHPPSVVTIHDLGYLHVPEAHPSRQRLMLDLTTRWSASVARHIIVPSSRTRDDLVDRYRIREEKITVIHHGVHPCFAMALHEPDTSFRERYGLHRAYVLAVGTIQPRKNLPFLARAMCAVDSDVDLVIAGKRGWMAGDVLHELDEAGLGDRLRLLDYVPDKDLPALYQHAEVLAQPSRFEGFGMPVLEAMASGTPVITSDGSSLSEIAGNAAMFYTQDDQASLSACIDAIVSDNEVSRDYKKRGLAWSGTLTWERAARKTRLVLQEALLDRE
jgi:glycosyltransferase involved in cell wall biosynthesis